MAVIIMLASSKGGVGKSTIACNLAVNLSKYRKNVILLDADVNQTSSKFDNLRTEMGHMPEFVCISSSTPTLHKICASEQIQDGYDVVIIDGEGADTKTFRSGVKAADIILIPVPPSPADLWESEEVISRIDQEKDENVKVFGVVNKKHINASINKEVSAVFCEFEKEYDIHFLQEELSNRIQYSYTFGNGLSVVEQNKSVDAKIEFDALTERILEEI